MYWSGLPHLLQVFSVTSEMQAHRTPKLSARLSNMLWRAIVEWKGAWL